MDGGLVPDPLSGITADRIRSPGSCTANEGEVGTVTTDVTEEVRGRGRLLRPHFLISLEDRGTEGTHYSGVLPVPSPVL